MPKIRLKKDIAATVLKRRDIDSKLLPDDEKTTIRQGQTLAVFNDIVPGKGQTYEVQLVGNAGNLKAGEKWFLYAPHWDMGSLLVIGDRTIKAERIKLNAPYFAQNDTRQDGWRYCFSHACAIAAFYLKPSLFDTAALEGYGQPERYYIDRLSGDTTNPQSQIDALKSCGISAYYTQSLSPKDLYECLKMGVPVPIGVQYKTSGHWICCVGRDGDDWLMHDPYGIRNGTSNFYAINSTDQDKLGAFDRYSSSAMDAIFWDLAQDNRKESGWAIVITEIDGKRVGTGLDL